MRGCGKPSNIRVEPSLQALNIAATASVAGTMRRSGQGMRYAALLSTRVRLYRYSELR